MMKATRACKSSWRNCIRPLWCIITRFFAFPAAQFVTEDFLANQKEKGDDYHASNDKRHDFVHVVIVFGTHAHKYLCRHFIIEPELDNLVFIRWFFHSRPNCSKKVQFSKMLKNSLFLHFSKLENGAFRSGCTLQK